MHRLVCVVVVILWLYARLFRYLHIAVLSYVVLVGIILKNNIFIFVYLYKKLCVHVNLYMVSRGRFAVLVDSPAEGAGVNGWFVVLRVNACK